VRETEHFVNEGRGWECKLCRAEDAPALGVEDAVEGAPSTHTLARFFREGEAEEREPRLSSRALARWKDDSRRALVCTRCGAEESLTK
jgi:Zn ribbon nucleic-acid-binding protein